MFKKKLFFLISFDFLNRGASQFFLQREREFFREKNKKKDKGEKPLNFFNKNQERIKNYIYINQLTINSLSFAYWFYLSLLFPLDQPMEVFIKNKELTHLNFKNYYDFMSNIRCFFLWISFCHFILGLFSYLKYFEDISIHYFLRLFFSLNPFITSLILIVKTKTSVKTLSFLKPQEKEILGPIYVELGLSSIQFFFVFWEDFFEKKVKKEKESSEFLII